MRRSRAREINVFSVSAIDLFACGMGVFIILYMVLIPLTTRAAKQAPTEVTDSTGEIEKTVKELTLALKAESTRNQELQSVLEATKAASDKVGAAAAEKLAAAEKEVAALQAELKNLNSQGEILKTRLLEKNQALEVEFRRNNGGGGGGNDDKVRNLFIQVKLDWSTTGHDVDLIISDPHGNEFSASQTGVEKAPGRHFGNTGGGPGFEIWQCFEGFAGLYRVYAVLRSYNGNKASADVGGTVELNRGILSISRQSLSHLDARILVLQFKVEQDGQYQVVN